MMSLTDTLEVSVSITCMRSTAMMPAAVAARPNSRLTLVGPITYLPANLSFMNSSISDTQTRPSAPFFSM